MTGCGTGKTKALAGLSFPAAVWSDFGRAGCTGGGASNNEVQTVTLTNEDDDVLAVDNDGTSGVPNVVLTSACDTAGNRTSLSATIDSTDDFLNTYPYNNLQRLTRVHQSGQTGGNTVNEKMTGL